MGNPAVTISLVQSGKTWTKYPLLVVTIFSVIVFFTGIFGIHNDWISRTFIITIHVLMLASCVLVMTAKPAIHDDDLSDEPILDRE